MKKNIDYVICVAFIFWAIVAACALFYLWPRADSDVISSSIHKIPSPKSNEVLNHERFDSI
jgi:hypothetical protein